MCFTSYLCYVFAPADQLWLCSTCLLHDAQGKGEVSVRVMLVSWQKESTREVICDSSWSLISAIVYIMLAYMPMARASHIINWVEMQNPSTGSTTLHMAMSSDV